MEIVKRIIHYLSYVIYFLILVFVLIEIPILFGYKPLIILSSSMEPNYKVGSIIYYHKVEKDDLKNKDVITYKMDDGTYITHRIIDVDGDYFETKGDMNDKEDPVRVKYSKIVGKATNWSIPFIGYGYILFLRYHTLIILIVTIILFLEFWYSNSKFFSNKKEEML